MVWANASCRDGGTGRVRRRTFLKQAMTVGAAVWTAPTVVLLDASEPSREARLHFPSANAERRRPEDAADPLSRNLP